MCELKGSLNSVSIFYLEQQLMESEFTWNLVVKINEESSGMYLCIRMVLYHVVCS